MLQVEQLRKQIAFKVVRARAVFVLQQILPCTLAVETGLETMLRIALTTESHLPDDPGGVKNVALIVLSTFPIILLPSCGGFMDV